MLKFKDLTDMSLLKINYLDPLLISCFENHNVVPLAGK